MTQHTPIQDEVAPYVFLPINNVVLFPGGSKSLVFRAPVSLAALRELKAHQKVFVVTLKQSDHKDLAVEDFYKVGVIGMILKRQQLPNGSVQVLFRADDRGALMALDTVSPYLTGRVARLLSRESADEELPHLVEALKSEFLAYVETKKTGSFQLGMDISDNHMTAGELADCIAPLLKASTDDKHKILAALNTRERVEQVYTLLYREIKQEEYESNLKKRVEEQMGKRQKEFFLNEQMKAIRGEMGDSTPTEIEELARKIVEANMPDAAREVAEKELKRMEMMGDNTHEATPIRNYLEWLTCLPWSVTSQDNASVTNARAILDEDHYGLEEPKQRIVEYIAVLNAVGKIRGSIICLSGPPGVGKTSLARSIARALGRKFARISLGGVRDEAEIRGHRRTYVGALPGKIIQTMKKVKTNNPLILLDEVDKISMYYNGGPTAALLEVLDPDQNNAFMDHYLEVEYDLSSVLFICTANDLANVPLPLRDRMEILELSGYTELEKVQIARRYLIPKQMDYCGLKAKQLTISDKQVLDIIRGYTREAGVRSLDRVLSKVCRKAVTERLEKEIEKTLVVQRRRRLRYLGLNRFQHNRLEKRSEVGMITGLAWTSVGGETLSIEVSIMSGKGKVLLTGKLGDVMKESAQAAISYVRAHANSLGIFSKSFRDNDIHIHVPAGGTPKDGPSAGIALAVAIVSAQTGIPIHWDVALTGEVTLRGCVLPIGGLKEKLLAAKRAQIKKVIIPAENVNNLHEISMEIRKGLDVVSVQHLSEVFPLLLERLPLEVHDERPLDDSDSLTITDEPSSRLMLNSNCQPQS